MVMRKLICVLGVLPILAGCTIARDLTADTETGMHTPAPVVLDNTCEPPTANVVAWIENNADYGGHYDNDDVAMVKVASPDKDQWWVVALVSYSDAWGGGMRRNDASYLTNAPSVPPSSEVWTYVGRPFGSEPGTTDWSGVDWPADLVTQAQKAQEAALSCTAKVPDFTPEAAVRECLTVPDDVRASFSDYLDTGTTTPLAMMYATEGNNPGEKWWLVISENLNLWLPNIPSDHKPSGDQLISNPSYNVQCPPEKRNYLDQLFWPLRECPLS